MLSNYARPHGEGTVPPWFEKGFDQQPTSNDQRRDSTLVTCRPTSRTPNLKFEFTWEDSCLLRSGSVWLQLERS
jgi:hypothetical protein